MESIYDYLKSNFNSSREIWESNLKKELKAESTSGHDAKTTADGVLSVLGLESPAHYLEVKESWKKASQSYYSFTQDTLQSIKDDLDNGVRFFIFDTDLDQSSWGKISEVFSSFSKREEVEVLILGNSNLEASSGFKVRFERDLASGRLAHEQGGGQALELALACLSFIEKKNPSQDAMVFLDSEIFSNIAKIRALRLLLMKVTQSWEVPANFRLIALTSFRDWTLYGRYSNILKNVSSVSSGYMGGADLVQSSGFLSLFEKMGLTHDKTEESRSRLLARNTAHILALESMLGVVDDPAFGSFHLENLTSRFAKEAWSLMQKLLPLSLEKREAEILRLATETREFRETEMRKRKHVMSGINDFPDRETLGLKTLPKESFYRRARSFEELRVRTENLAHKPKIYLGIYGSYALLNARVNFAKNYFQLLGLEVEEGEPVSDANGLQRGIDSSKADVVVLVASDADYEKLQGVNASGAKFVAGKVSIDGFKNIFAGQDAFEVLRGLISSWEDK